MKHLCPNEWAYLIKLDCITSDLLLLVMLIKRPPQNAIEFSHDDHIKKFIGDETVAKKTQNLTEQ